MARAMISPIKGWKAALVRRFAPRAFTKRASILTREKAQGRCANAIYDERERRACQ